MPWVIVGVSESCVLPCTISKKQLEKYNGRSENDGGNGGVKAQPGLHSSGTGTHLIAEVRGLPDVVLGVFYLTPSIRAIFLLGQSFTIRLSSIPLSFALAVK